MDETSDDITSFIGADDFASLRSDTVKDNLTKLLDSRYLMKFPDISESFAYSDYLFTRDNLAQSATLAAIAGDSRLDLIIRKWVDIQQEYARHVIRAVNDGIQDQKDLLDTYDEELEAGETDRKRYEQLQNRTAGELDAINGIEEFLQLKLRISQLDKTAEEREQLHRSIAGISKVEQTLTRLIESDVEAIHYIVPSVEETLDRLGQGNYDGPEFAPFTVTDRVKVDDIFLRGAEIPSMKRNNSRHEIVVDDLPQVLSELALVYEHIINLRPGTKIIPAKLRDQLSLNQLGAKGLGSYLDENQVTFGVRKIDAPGSRTFARQETGSRLSKKDFVRHMHPEKLQKPDLRQVNEFYFQQALVLLREQPQAYEGFTKETVSSLAENQGLPVTKIYIARNLRKADGVTCIKQTEKAHDLDVYRFAEIIPTQRQIEYVKDAVDEFGINRFTLKDLTRRVTNQHNSYRIMSDVAVKVLEDHLDSWNLKIASNDPVKYQRRNTKNTNKKVDVGNQRLI